MKNSIEIALIIAVAVLVMIPRFTRLRAINDLTMIITETTTKYTNKTIITGSKTIASIITHTQTEYTTKHGQ